MTLNTCIGQLKHANISYTLFALLKQSFMCVLDLIRKIDFLPEYDVMILKITYRRFRGACCPHLQNSPSRVTAPFMDCTEDGRTNLYSEVFIVQRQRFLNLRSCGNSPLPYTVCVIFIECFAIGLRCKIAHFKFFSIRGHFIRIMKGLLKRLWDLTQC